MPDGSPRSTARRLWRALRLFVVCGSLLAAAPGGAQAPAEPLQLVATIPDLAAIAQAVGAPLLSVTVLSKGTEDPHFLEVKPSFVKALNEADLFVHVGLDLEAGYLRPLLQNARNPRILPGGAGYVDASRAVVPIEVQAGPTDRSMGDIHAYGNPHYWLDPLNGVRVGRLLRDALSALRPGDKTLFNARFDAFARQVAAALVGSTLAAKYDVEKLCLLFEHGKLVSFLDTQGEGRELSGWLGRLSPYVGTAVVDDHNMWPYFARRFGLRVVGHMEAKPGIPPTTSHLAVLVEEMRVAQVRLILAAPYYDTRHARFLADATGARVVPLTHMVGGRPGTEDYVRMIDYNVGQIVAALGGAG